MDDTILLLTNDRDIYNIIHEIFKKEKDIAIVDSKDIEEAEAILGRENKSGVSIIVVDYEVSEKEISDFLDYIQNKKFHIPVVILSSKEDNKISYLAGGAFSFIKKPFYGNEVYFTVKNLLDLFNSYKGLEDANAIIVALSRALDRRDTYTEGHSTRVYEYSIMIYDALGFNDEQEKRTLRIGCLLHDIGKIGIPDSILKSEKGLSEEEREIVNQHPVMGYEICKDIKNIQDSLPIIRSHHEKLDGSGYPDGLTKYELSDIVQIVAVADIFDALTSKRTYRDAKGINDALQILESEARQGKLNSYFVSIFKKLIEDRTRERV